MSEECKKFLGIHLGLILAELICLSAFYVELRRALEGNALSWAYVVEWPVLGGYGVYVWRRLMRERRGLPPQELTVDQDEDRSLREYNAYLARIHSTSTETNEPPTQPHEDSPS